MKTSMLVRWEETAKAQRAARAARLVADYRRRHPEATARDAILLLLADLEAHVGRTA